jgi:hypothetical protein
MSSFTINVRVSKLLLKIRKKRKKHGKALPLGQSGEYHGGAVLFSPRAVQRARDEQVV